MSTIAWVAVNGRMVRADENLLQYLKSALLEAGEAWERAKTEQTRAISRVDEARRRCVDILEKVQIEERRRGV